MKKYYIVFAVDDVLLKVINAKQKRFKIKYTED